MKKLNNIQIFNVSIVPIPDKTEDNRDTAKRQGMILEVKHLYLEKKCQTGKNLRTWVKPFL